MPPEFSAQCICFLWAVALGFLLGLCYEPLRILRAAIPHGALAVGVEDFCFCLVASAAFFILCFSLSNGTIRWFAVAGLLLGGFFYFETLGRLISQITRRLIAAIRRLWHRIMEKLLRPIICAVLRAHRAFCSYRKRRKEKRAQLSALRYDQRIRKQLPRAAGKGFRKF